MKTLILFFKIGIKLNWNSDFEWHNPNIHVAMETDCPDQVTC